MIGFLIHLMKFLKQQPTLDTKKNQKTEKSTLTNVTKQRLESVIFVIDL